MTNFSDQLFTDLMREHAETLRRTELPAAARRHPGLRRGAWAAGGAGALAVGITASLAAFGGTADAAYAISPHSDGTLTVSLSDLSGVTGANAALGKLGMRVVVVPARDGCPSMETLPAPRSGTGEISGSISGNAHLGADKQAGTVTVQARGIPAGDLLVIGIASKGGAVRLAPRLTTAPAPACVSLPVGVPGVPGAPGGGHMFRSGGVPGTGGGPAVRNGGAKSAGSGRAASAG